MNRTKIEWCDWTWNPVVGCSPVSAGCANCYAAAISRRFGLPWGRAHFVPERLHEPAKVNNPGRIFVCSMSDIGHETVQDDWRHQIYDAMMAAHWHQYIILTKRPGSWLRDGLPREVWVGVTAENQANYEQRWSELTAQIQGPGRHLRFLSVEPMLGPIVIRKDWRRPVWPRPDWTICGPETGPGARPCRDEWIDDLAAQSLDFFDKRKTGWTRREFPA